MYDRNLIFWCEACDCISYRCPECGNNLCNGGGCGLCSIIHKGVWAWIDSQNIDEVALSKSGKIIPNDLKNLPNLGESP